MNELYTLIMQAGDAVCEWFWYFILVLFAIVSFLFVIASFPIWFSVYLIIRLGSRKYKLRGRWPKDELR